MASLNLSVQGAYDWVGTLNDGIVDDFISCHKSLPHFESESGDPAETETINRHVREYADCLGNWVRATDCWGFEVSRPVLLLYSMCLTRREQSNSRKQPGSPR